MSAGYTADELENSFPLDPGRRFARPEDNTLFRSVLAGMDSDRAGTRKRKRRDTPRHEATVEALLANLIAAHLNLNDCQRFVGVSFNRNDYAGLELSCTTMVRCRDYLHSEGLIEVAPGFFRPDADGVGSFGRCTRIRPQPDLRRMIDALTVAEKTLTISDKQLIRRRKWFGKQTDTPEDIEVTRDLLKAVNSRVLSADITLHIDASIALGQKILEDEGEDTDEAAIKRRYAGDLTAKSMYRSFKGDWSRGGRIYGGWWMSLPGYLRRYLTIDGELTVEIDYSMLHPTMLYHRSGIALYFDPYVLDEPCTKPMRDLGKKTFNRLLNREEADPNKRVALRAGSGDNDILKKGWPFKLYVSSLVHQMTAIKSWFGSGVGVLLQREDSELAISVLRSMEAEGIATLPIHDSFIVAQQHEVALQLAMHNAFFSKYGNPPKLKVSRAFRPHSRPVHN